MAIIVVPMFGKKTRKWLKEGRKRMASGNPWRTRKSGTKRQVGKHFRLMKPTKKALPRRLSMFREPKYQKYAEIVKMGSVEEARKSAMELSREFSRSVRSKKLRIIRVAHLASNRAKVMSKSPRLSMEARKRLGRVSIVYGALRKRLSRKYARK